MTSTGPVIPPKPTRTPHQPATPVGQHHPAAPNALPIDPGRITELAVSVWRLGKKVATADQVTPSVRRHAQAVMDALAEAGVQTSSYEGVAYDPGLRLKVLAYQPTPGLEREVITETVRPAVFLHGEAISLSEVIVGTPPEQPPPPPKSPPKTPAESVPKPPPAPADGGQHADAADGAAEAEASPGAGTSPSADVETPNVETPNTEAPNAEAPDNETPHPETTDAETPHTDTPNAGEEPTRAQDHR
ncbi:hypothetical protein AAHZ94_19905 [Streptomyces sp. HSW2009]|uniref:hypothetical protein n=1 Tax=Streptomyces sp. HSW2009 TaxID=3142890 RepID=UPI0032ECD14A